MPTFVCPWKPNGAHQARLEAGARYERTLEAVACMPWLGIIALMGGPRFALATLPE
jgi:hypothetical protein